ncbi:MAG: hypothetical protein GXP49_07680 [Deltaproteobacteria bacterium]|nr:hypothetical protein [Deltaproteobacteria bacterium]
MFLRFRPKTKIADLKEGSICVVEGTAAAGDTLQLPAGDNIRCLCYDITMESYRVGSRGRGRAMWIPDKAERKATNFFVSDDTGKVWVQADTPGLILSGALTLSGRLRKKANKRFVAAILRDGDIIRIRGLVSASRPQDGEPKDTLVIRPGPKGDLEILVRKKFEDKN